MSRGLENVRCCNLEELLENDDLELVHSECIAPGYAACLLRTPGASGIILAPTSNRGRERFSIAHELGHFHIPSHADVSGYCLDADLSAREGDGKTLEWEANDFATELLMPRELFARDADRQPLCVATAEALASPEKYDVSLMAALRRMIDTTSRAGAVVVSSNGRIQWIARSGAFKLWLPARTDRVGHETMAGRADRGLALSEEPQEVPFAAWLRRPKVVRGPLLESTYRIERTEQVVSVLWHVDEDDASA